MRNPIQKAFDPIKADPDLIQRTRAALVDGQTEIAGLQSGRRSPFMRGLAAAVAVVLLAGACAVAGLIVLHTPVAAVSLDINPSITIQVNAFRRVISVTGLNAEGKKLVTEDLINQPVQSVVARLIADAAKAGYLADDGSTIINITTATDKAGLKDKIGAETGKAAEAALKNAEKKAVIFQDYTGFARVEQARKLGITPGRLNLIEKLVDLNGAASMKDYLEDHEAEIKQYAGMSNQEIMKSVVALKKEQREKEKADRKAGKGNSPTGAATDLTDPDGEDSALLQMEQALASAQQNAQQNTQQNQGKSNNGQGKK